MFQLPLGNLSPVITPWEALGMPVISWQEAPGMLV